MATRLYRPGPKRRQETGGLLFLKLRGLRPNAEALLNILKDNPFQNPPPYEKLVGDLAGAYSRRINVQHRLVYQVLEQDRIVKVIRMWTHYE